MSEANLIKSGRMTGQKKLFYSSVEMILVHEEQVKKIYLYIIDFGSCHINVVNDRSFSACERKKRNPY